MVSISSTPAAMGRGGGTVGTASPLAGSWTCGPAAACRCARPPCACVPLMTRRLPCGSARRAAAAVDGGSRGTLPLPNGCRGEWFVGQHPGTVVDGAQGVMAAEAEGGVDQGHMRERLREVAHEAPGQRVVLLREQAEIVAQGQESLEELLGLI